MRRPPPGLQHLHHVPPAQGRPRGRLGRGRGGGRGHLRAPLPGARLPAAGGRGHLDRRRGPHHGGGGRPVDPRGPGAGRARPRPAGGAGAGDLPGHRRRLRRAGGHVAPDRDGAGRRGGWHERGERRPIRCQWSREESIVGHHKRHRGRVHARWGATADGRVAVAEATCHLDAGAYNYTTNKVLGNLHLCVSGPYEIRHLSVDSHGVLTNDVPGGAFRGFGAPQAAFVAETQMNKLAERLGVGSGGDSAAATCCGTARSARPAPRCRPGSAFPWSSTAAPRRPAGPRRSARWRTSRPSRRCRRPRDARAGARVRLRVQERRLLVRLPRALRGPDRPPRGRRPGRRGRAWRRGVPRGAVPCRRRGGPGQPHRRSCRWWPKPSGVPVERVDPVFSDTAVTGDSGSASASRLTWMSGNAILGAAEEADKAWRARAAGGG